MLVETESGCKFIIDLERKTWARIEAGYQTTAPLRTSSGSFITISPIKVGQVLRMFCPPINDSSSARLIMTSFVTNIEERAHIDLHGDY